jgi:predicted ABC-type ATPase
MTTARMRMVGGPNGSGKSTLLEYLQTQIHSLGFVLNPDLLERSIRDAEPLDFATWRLTLDTSTLRDFVRTHPLGNDAMARALTVTANHLQVLPHARGGYLAAVLSDFLRRQWIAGAETFTFETVMSGRDKIDLLDQARAAGYRTYLYFVCTDDPRINRERVTVRVEQGGHGVPAEKIEQRYHRSLSLLYDAIQRSHRSYLFDNSGKAHRLIAEFDEHQLVQASSQLPAWFVRHVLEKLPA